LYVFSHYVELIVIVCIFILMKKHIAEFAESKGFLQVSLNRTPFLKLIVNSDFSVTVSNCTKENQVSEIYYNTNEFTLLYTLTFNGLLNKFIPYQYYEKNLQDTFQKEYYAYPRFLRDLKEQISAYVMGVATKKNY